MLGAHRSTLEPIGKWERSEARYLVCVRESRVKAVERRAMPLEEIQQDRGLECNWHGKQAALVRHGAERDQCIALHAAPLEARLSPTAREQTTKRQRLVAFA